MARQVYLSWKRNEELQYIAMGKRLHDEEVTLQVERDREILAEPLFLRGTNGVAVVLFHGWTSVPYEMRPIAQYLHARGYSVYAPLLCGHGTVPEDLEGLTWEDWREDALRAYDKMQLDHEDVFVGGMSVGGTLALHCALVRKDVCGILLLGTPYKMRFQRFGAVFVRLYMQFFPYKNKIYPQVKGGKRPITELITYPRYPFASALQAMQVIEQIRPQLSHIAAPCMIVQAEHDYLIWKKSLHTYAKELGSEVIRTRFVAHAYHNFIGDAQHQHIFEEVVDFFDKTSLVEENG